MLKITAAQKIIEANNRIKVDMIKAEIDKITQDWLKKNSTLIDMIMTDRRGYAQI